MGDSNSESKAISEAVKSFYHDVSEHTSMLMYLLTGVERYRQWWPKQQGVSIPPEMPNLRLMPHVGTDDPESLFGNSGIAAQMAYVGWVGSVFSNWEHCHRDKIRDALKQSPPTIYEPQEMFHQVNPVLTVMGDLRHIRNDMLHKGVATTDDIAKCEILKWFEVGEPIVFHFNHVMDFLNQLGLLYVMTVVSDERSFGMSGWRVYGSEEELSDWQPIPLPISVRAMEGPIQDSILLSLVFDNGFFSTFMTDVPKGIVQRNAELLHIGRLENMEIVFGDDLKLFLPPDIYRILVSAHFESLRQDHTTPQGMATAPIGLGDMNRENDEPFKGAVRVSGSTGAYTWVHLSGSVKLFEGQVTILSNEAEGGSSQ